MFLKLYLSYFETLKKVPFATNLEGGGVKALVALELFLRLPLYPRVPDIYQTMNTTISIFKVRHHVRTQDSAFNFRNLFLQRRIQKKSCN